MKALDTNIVVRIIVNDDAEQVRLASRILQTPCLLTLTVVLETAWILRSNYRFSRKRLAEALTRLLDIPTLATPDEAGVRWAIERYRDHGADLDDMVHLVAARGAKAFVSFERHLADEAGEDAPLPIERLI